MSVSTEEKAPSGALPTRGIRARRRPKFGPLSESAFRVDRSAARERFWFADGAWLNQGQTASVVGVVWTHWLADRGITLPGVTFDDAYALDLYAESQQIMGQKEDLNSGTFVSAGAAVLMDRKIIDDCYQCNDIQSVTLALLERGPVVAGLSWRQSMYKPESVAGWRVCRLAADDPVVGGHAVLLNGIALDLEIGGVKGFIRFKNSWGRDWADSGHCLISIDDLAKIMDGQDSLLPIPARAVLGPSGRQDIAITEADIRYAEDAISNDSWTIRDTAGYEAYADAVARGIQHPDTRPPLTIGIRAHWGAGKTSLMRMIQQRLEWPPDVLSAGPGSQRLIEVRGGPAAGRKRFPWWPFSTGQDASRITNRALLRGLKSAATENGSGSAAPGLSAAPSPPSAQDDRWRATVWFNPWMYQTGEQVWAGLAHEIIQQATDRMSPLDRERFWLALNLRRVDEQAVRRKVYGLILQRVLPWLVTGILLLIAGIAAFALSRGRHFIDVALGGSSGIIVIAGIVQAVKVMQSNVTGSLSRIVTSAAGFRKAAGGQLAGAYDKLVESPDYRGQSGVLYLVQTDLGRVLDLLATPERPIVIFVDDLDRCTPGTVVQVIEAINLFVAGQFSNVIFVIAMEPEMVAAHIEAAYGDLARKMADIGGSDGQPEDLGWKFLEKIVNLPLSLPVMEPVQRTAFYASLFNPAAAPGDGRAAAATEAQIQAAEADLTEVSLGAVVQRAVHPAHRGDAAEAAEKEAVRRVVERRLTRGDPDVEDVIAYAIQHLEPNPREIKRFVRLFRFFVMIYMERRLRGLPTPGSLQDVAKLAVLAIRWPGLMATMAEPAGADQRMIFDLLEDPPVAARRAKEAQRTADRRALRQALLRTGLGAPAADRLMSAEFREFMKSAPRVGGAARGYL